MLQPLAIDIVSVQSQVVYGNVGNNILFSAVVTGQILAGHSVLEAAQLACAAVVDAVTFTHKHQCAELLLPD